MPGTVARRRPETMLPLKVRQGKLLDTLPLGNNFYEIYTMPPPKYFTAEYEVTIWAQYTQQMNDILMAIPAPCQVLRVRRSVLRLHEYNLPEQIGSIP